MKAASDPRATAGRTPRITIAVPAHNPDRARLARVLAELFRQSLGQDHWEILLVDNSSDPPLVAGDARVRRVCEPRLGLTWARARAIREARGEVIVFVDDDNLLDPGYLQAALGFLNEHPEVAAIGGAIAPEFENPPPPWVTEFADLLALRDFGAEVRISDGSGRYPQFAPVGAGMVIRKRSAMRWSDRAGRRVASLPDRRGSDLSSSGDNDMIFCCLGAGERVAYVPELRLTHLIPGERITSRYLARLNRGIEKSWIQVLHLNGACPWSAIPGWTVPLRKMRAFFRYRAWRRPTQWIRWQGACGHFEGRASLRRLTGQGTEGSLIKEKLRRLGVGRAYYHLWHRPRAGIRQSIRHGGPVEQLRTRRGQRDMECAAGRLPPIAYQPEPGLVPIHFLTGSRFWYQTAFCIWTYAKHSRTIPRVVLHDDGSLREHQRELLRRLIPEVRIIGVRQAEEILNEKLPVKLFAELNRQWRDYVNIRKLIGVHLCGDGWKLVLDSDMLFQALPSDLLHWQRAPHSILVMKDALTCYGYPLNALHQIVATPVPERVNVGVTGMMSQALSWAKLESWCGTLISDHGPSYYLEQALVALLAAENGVQFLDSTRYQLIPDSRRATDGASLCHYVDLAKSQYFRHEWRKALET